MLLDGKIFSWAVNNSWLPIGTWWNSHLCLRRFCRNSWLVCTPYQWVNWFGDNHTFYSGWLKIIKFFFRMEKAWLFLVTLKTFIVLFFLKLLPFNLMSIRFEYILCNSPKGKIHSTAFLFLEQVFLIPD